MNYVRRFVFVHYEDLLEVRFRQLEKVTDKLYVFVPADVEQIPLGLVRQVQAMGRDLAWIDTGLVTYEEAKLIMAFRIGTLHEQVDPGVEFAILSEAAELDSLVEHLQSSGRRCVRIKPKPASDQEASPKGARFEADRGGRDAFRQNSPTEKPSRSSSKSSTAKRYDDDDALPLSDLTSFLRNEGGSDLAEVEDLDTEPRRSATYGSSPVRGTVLWDVSSLPATGAASQKPAKPRRGDVELAQEVEPLVEDLIRKLIRSGNRPNDLSGLRSYILLHSEEAKSGRYVDDIIRVMQRKGEIELDGGDLRYTF